MKQTAIFTQDPLHGVRVNTLEMELRRMDGLSGGRMIVRFQEEKLLLEAEDTLISVGGLGISPRQALTVFGIKKD